MTFISFFREWETIYENIVKCLRCLIEGIHKGLPAKFAISRPLRFLAGVNEIMLTSPENSNPLTSVFMRYQNSHSENRPDILYGCLLSIGFCSVCKVTDSFLDVTNRVFIFEGFFFEYLQVCSFHSYSIHPSIPRHNDQLGHHFGSQDILA